MKKEGIRVLYSDINSFKQPNETVWKAYKDAFQNWLAQQLMGVTEENIQHSLIQQFFSNCPWILKLKFICSFFNTNLQTSWTMKKNSSLSPTAPSVHLFIITLSIHSSIIHPSIQLPHKYLLNVFPLMELIKNDDIYYGAIILEITRNKINGREGIQCSICVQI